MRRYFIRRILLLIPTLFIVSFAVFSMVRVIPGDVVELMVAEQGFAEDREEMREILGLDKPILQQYFIYMKNIIFEGDMGTSLWSREPVVKEIGRRLPVSLNLAALAIIWTIIIGIPMGVISALKQDTWVDYLVRSTAIGGLSVPNFWIATMLMVFGAIWFKWVPPMDYVPFTENPAQNLSQLLAPSLILSIARAAAIMRMTRTMMLEVMREDYIRTARAKGLSKLIVVIRHALKNALIPVLIIIGLQLAFLVGGTVIMESIFVLPGMGKYLIDAISWRDYPVVQGINLILCSVIISINLIVDLLYGFIDPRIRYR
jgi:peptide/nickel transport system permease protein